MRKRFWVPAILLAIGVGVALRAPRPVSYADVTRMTTKKYTYEAYPQWAQQHTEPCPSSIVELDPFMNGVDRRDRWGHSYEMLCGAALPPTARGIAIYSRGEDGKAGTDDDIRSWE